MSRTIRSELEIFYHTLQPSSSLGLLDQMLLTWGIYCDKTITAAFALKLLDLLRSNLLQRLAFTANPPSISGGHYNKHRLEGIVLELNHAVCTSLLIPMRVLFAYSGWHVTEEEASGSTERLRSWFAGRPEEVRRAVWHSSQILSLVERSSTKGSHEGIALVMATLVLWSWMDYCSVSSCNITSSVGPNLRLDKATSIASSSLDNHDCKTLAKWLHCADFQVRLFLPSIGPLHESGASARLVRHSVDILGKRKEWLLNEVIRLNLIEQFTQSHDRL